MKRKSLIYIALTLVTSALCPVSRAQPVPPGANDEARQWLERMVETTQTLNYEGTFIYIQGPHVEAMRIVHSSGPNGERQRLLSLNGPPREVLVDNQRVVSVLPNRQMAFASYDASHASFPLSIPREIGRLGSHYQFELLGEDRIAGLDARIIVIKPRDAWRFGYRMWLDRRNAMVLRSALLDEQGHPLEQIMFTDLQVKTQIDAATFQPSVPPGDPAPAPQGQVDPPVGESVKDSAWRVESLPEGFVKVLHKRFAESPNQHLTEHLVFADGLATISVFVEKLDGGPALLQGASQLGSMNAFGRTLEGHQVLVVGEVPAATVQHLASQIVYDPARLKANGP